jgi:DNA polymerase III subunit delta'
MIYPWLQQDWLQLAGYIDQQRIPQALLISARSGMGALDMSKFFAASLLCHSPGQDSQPCGHCRGCTLYQAKTHPDYIFIEPEQAGKAIGIAVIRQLIDSLALKPQFSGRRVVLINGADALNNAAANAFLKCLEEPAERTSIILLAEQPAKLPATIRSRCQMLTVAQAKTEDALAWLSSQNVTDALPLLEIAQGSPLLALKYGKENTLQCWHEYHDNWLKVAHGKADIVILAEQWSKQEQVSLSVLLSWLSQWTADLIKLANNPDYVVSYKMGLQELLKKLDLKQVFQFYDMLLRSVKLQDSQLNKQLLLEQILIDWSTLNKA